VKLLSLTGTLIEMLVSMENLQLFQYIASGFKMIMDRDVFTTEC